MDLEGSLEIYYISKSDDKHPFHNIPYSERVNHSLFQYIQRQKILFFKVHSLIVKIALWILPFNELKICLPSSLFHPLLSWHFFNYLYTIVTSKLLSAQPNSILSKQHIKCWLSCYLCHPYLLTFGFSLLPLKPISQNKNNTNKNDKPSMGFIPVFRPLGDWSRTTGRQAWATQPVLDQPVLQSETMSHIHIHTHIKKC